MINRFCFEALDCSMRDVILEGDNYNNDLPFCGKTILLGGDFCQILLVIPGGTKKQIINAYLTSLTLWSRFTVLTLIENIRLSTNGLTFEEKANIHEFSKWTLSVGNGYMSDLPSLSEPDDYFVVVPSNLLFQPSCDPISAIKVTMQLIISTEYINQLEFNGAPSHTLALKIGTPATLLRNVSPSIGLCNGTRLIITQLSSKSHFKKGLKIISYDNEGRPSAMQKLLSTKTLSVLFQKVMALSIQSIKIDGFLNQWTNRQFNCLLVDGKGNAIQASAKGNNIQSFANSIIEGDYYQISGF
uniref:ATP-dependent DNA helicase n=1 Tax=Salix viminalis TaxID=40686 RepID=A0A6N2MMY2_SALVM